MLFTAAIVSNVESVQQTLNAALDVVYSHVFLSVEMLIWIRSLAIVLLIVAHTLRHVQVELEKFSVYLAMAEFSRDWVIVKLFCTVEVK